MPETITIAPVTRVEGHAAITIRLDDDGRVADSRLHITEFRGFEGFCRGRPVWEMPSLTARTCGICPVSHLLAGSKAAEAIMGLTPPPAARRLRQLVNLAQLVQSHALSFFHLSAPDLLLGMDADPAQRNVFGLIEADPAAVRQGVGLRSFGQSVIAAVAGRQVHSPGIVPGGVAHPLTAATRDDILARLPDAIAAAQAGLERYLAVAGGFRREIDALGSFPSFFVGLANNEGTWEHTDGYLRIIDADGKVLGDRINPAQYSEWIGEAASSDSYLKSPFLRFAVPEGADPAAGMYRVGPLARLNLCHAMGTPLADAALTTFREHAGAPAPSSFHYHHARLVEALACLERMWQLLDDPAILDPTVRGDAAVANRHGVGVSEAPRGTLIHDYQTDDDGLVTGVTMIIATGHNSLAMNASLRQAAREFVDGPDLPEGVMNRMEATIRAYDPCFSCSTHAVGQMPMQVTVLDAAGEVVLTARR